MGAMKALVGVGAVVILGGVFLGFSSNSFVEPYNEAEKTASQVQNVINARYNKVTANSQIVDRYATHEQSTFVGTAQGRGGIQPPAKPAALTASTKDVLNDPKLQAQLGQAETNLTNYVNAAVEAYPDLKANKLFSDMMTEINGSTNRVTVERKHMIDAIQKYDVQVGKFPANLVAGIMGYHRLPYYAADANQQEVNTNMFNK